MSVTRVEAASSNPDACLQRYSCNGACFWPECLNLQLHFYSVANEATELPYVLFSLFLLLSTFLLLRMPHENITAFICLLQVTFIPYRQTLA